MAMRMRTKMTNEQDKINDIGSEFEDITKMVQNKDRIVLTNLDGFVIVLEPMDIYVDGVEVHFKETEDSYTMEYSFDEICLLYVGEISGRKCLCDGH